MAGPYLPIRAISRSQAVRIGGKRVTATETTYVDLSGELGGANQAYSALKELRQHLALGAVIVVGGITGTNSDWVVVSGLVTTNTKAEEPEIKDTAGEVRQRSTGTTLEVTAQSKAKAFGKVAAAGKERVDLVYLLVEGAEKGTVGYEKGEEVAEGKAVAKATPAKAIPLATLTTVNGGEPATTASVDKRPRP